MLTKEKQENFVESQKILDAQNWCIIRQNNHLEAQITLQQGHDNLNYTICQLVKYIRDNTLLYSIEWKQK